MILVDHTKKQCCKNFFRMAMMSKINSQMANAETQLPSSKGSVEAMSLRKDSKKKII
jgi:hypothetical protein